MALKVIGAGFGRTGTLSLKSALETLGVGPCYHMVEVFSHPEHIPMWHTLAFGGKVDWDELFKGYQSTVDWPGCSYWRELAAYYPDAKVLLSHRDPEEWYKSMVATIYTAMKQPIPDSAPAPAKMQGEMVKKAVVEKTFQNRFDDKDYALSVFRSHIAEVKAAIPASKLLVFDVREGWGPLCKFLDVPIPSTDFPRLNDTATTQALIRSMGERYRTQAKT